MSKPLQLSFFGDDFTGSTDALESLSLAGARTILFIEPPAADRIQSYGDLDAIGVAGITRSLSPQLMEPVLTDAFHKLKALGSRHVHYKICSTFDSSPEVGSIGKVIDIGAEIFQNEITPVLVAAPWLGRYMVFGNLFARLGIGSRGIIYRLDRHPSMSRHPVTPAHESDLRLHLSKQTTKKAGLLDILQLDKPVTDLRSQVNAMKTQGYELFFIDALAPEHLAVIGELLDAMADQTLLSVGSSGIEMALGQYWNKRGQLSQTKRWENPVVAKPLLVISGSCSPVTAAQIKWALANGFSELVLDIETLVPLQDQAPNLHAYTLEALNELQNGRSLIVHTGGTEQGTDQRFPVSPVLLGAILGKIARDLVEVTKLKRVVVSGGDTSSYAARAMGVESVEMIAPLVAGAPLCRATAPGSPLDGVELNFKGGQVGDETYFGILQRGSMDFV